MLKTNLFIHAWLFLCLCRLFLMPLMNCHSIYYLMLFSGWMAETKCAVRKLEDMETNVLVKIFKELNMIELVPVSQICRLWNIALERP